MNVTPHVIPSDDPDCNRLNAENLVHWWLPYFGFLDAEVVCIGNDDDPNYSYLLKLSATPEEIAVLRRFADAVLAARQQLGN